MINTIQKSQLHNKGTTSNRNLFGMCDEKIINLFITRRGKQ